MCSLYDIDFETSNHLFLSYPFAAQFWFWLRDMISCDIDLYSVLSILKICGKRLIPQVSDLILANVVNVISMIWR